MKLNSSNEKEWDKLSGIGEVLAKRIYLLYEGALTESHIHQQSWPIDSAKELCEYILK